jgi:hypothetical protein
VPAALVLLSAAGCSKSSASGAASGAQDHGVSGTVAIAEGPSASLAAAAAVTSPEGESPPAGKWPRTTNAKIALDNFDAQLRGVEAAVARSPADAPTSRRLVDLLLTRGQFCGTIADYERAASIADALVTSQPNSPDAHLAHASTLGTFHLFEAALREAQAAADAQAPPGAVTHVRATALLAEGRFDEVEALGLWHDPSGLDTTELAGAAILAGERGKMAESEALFEKARAAFRDVTPFPVAWIAFQHGWLLERKGDRVGAKAYFVQAHETLPPFAHAAVHLAALETPDEARVLLEPLLGQSDDPEVEAAYGDALRRLGRGEEAKPFIARARARYDELLAKHPEAFADHAAVFFLGLGQDPARALAYATLNANNRQTEAALDLLLLAALAAGKQAEACAAAARGETLAYATPAFRTLVKTTDATCAPKGAPAGTP